MLVKNNVNTIKNCNHCNEVLFIDLNWTVSNKKKCNYICVTCSSLKQKYGINKKQYESILFLQNNVCAICGCEEIAKVNKNIRNKTKRLSVDHCHKTGKIRSLLCLNCNQAIGKLKDSPQLLRKAAEYLEKHNAINKPIE